MVRESGDEEREKLAQLEKIIHKLEACLDTTTKERERRRQFELISGMAMEQLELLLEAKLSCNCLSLSLVVTFKHHASSLRIIFSSRGVGSALACRVHSSWVKQ
ncbi:hypothetical protein QOT17_007587 [Balamuthia mandrillaris]